MAGCVGRARAGPPWWGLRGRPGAAVGAPSPLRGGPVPFRVLCSAFSLSIQCGSSAGEATYIEV